ncbi:hypothetical protein SAMN05216321_10198 [Cupriavidus sp. OV038]|jgi:hypothetical protein|uniref:hypothetical protein n=1 Tax=unclassified Cupriavidus TaxID=2640874 RepID=UPI0008E40F56|nr:MULTISPECIES: hypothetical protein [unclassified Cupriavidus]SFB68348.1 hypothetical protein SAMN05216321_10198 [Cupriavidus sp. OV038]SFO57587.1 hypothetical protein SAMN05216322_10198 [Cupriavidus sp. OV096]
MTEVVTEVMSHFAAHGLLDLVLLVLNGLVATAIFLILLFSRPEAEGPLAFYGRVARYAFAAIYSILAARVWTGSYLTPVEYTEVAVNCVVLWLALVVRGDLSVFLAAVRVVRDRRAP